MGRRILGVVLVAILLSCAFVVSPVNAVSSWSKPRPTTYKVFDDKIGNAASDASAAVGLGVDVYDYVESGSGYPYDEVRLRTSVSANTRIGIQYEQNYALHGYNWLDVTDPTNINGDDSGAWIELGFTLLFYGVNYHRIWVCSNGFICLDSAPTDPVPKSIPSNDQINTIIAPFWRDLKPNHGGSITTGTKEFDVKTYFVISWNNVPDANNAPQTFEAMIEIRQGWGSSDFHNKIYFQYKSVTKNLPTTVGIENQLGDKAYSFSLNDVGNSVNLGVTVWTAGCRLVQLTLKLTKSDSYAKIETMETDKGGYNVYLQNTDPVPWGGLFESAIGLAADLLLPAKAAIMFGILVITAQTASVLAGDLSLPQFESTDADFGQNEAHITSQCYDEQYGGGPYDATLSSIFLWQFSDPNNRAHSLTITTELLYEDLVDFSYYTITTSTTLYMYTGYHYVDVGTTLIGAGQTTGATIWIDGAAYSSPISSLIVSEGSHSFQCESPIYRSSKKYVFDHWNDGNTNNYRVISVTSDQTLTAYYRARYTLTISVYPTPPGAGTTSPTPESHEYSDGTVVPVTATAYSGFVFSCWLLDSTYYYVNPLSVTMNQAHSLTAYFTYSGGGGGGCPYVSTWNGTDYVLDNNLLPFSKLGNGLDVEDYYTLEQPLVRHNGKYSLVISEFENEHSYLDQVKLLAVDHGYGVNIAVTPSGEILTYKNPAPPISCVDNNGTDRLSQINHIDGNFSDPTTYFQGNKNEYLVLNFGQITLGPAKLIVRNDMLCMDKCIWVQVKNASGEWETIEMIASRATWATEGVNLSPYLIEGQDLMVRLFWTQPHKLDFVGLDTTAPEHYEVHYANLAKATHSTEGNVKTLLKENDDKCAELVPGQQIQLDFTLPNDPRKARTFILYVEGHYYTITQPT